MNVKVEKGFLSCAAALTQRTWFAVFGFGSPICAIHDRIIYLDRVLSFVPCRVDNSMHELQCSSSVALVVLLNLCYVWFYDIVLFVRRSITFCVFASCSTVTHSSISWFLERALSLSLLFDDPAFGALSLSLFVDFPLTPLTGYSCGQFPA